MCEDDVSIRDADVHRYGRLGRQGRGQVLQIDVGHRGDLAIRLDALVQVFEQYLEVILIK